MFNFKKKVTESPPGLDVLRERHPWPDISELDGDPPHLWTLDGGGRELVTKLIKKTHPRIMLEVGAFLGGSALKWLATRPDFTLVMLDPWSREIESWIDEVIASPPDWVPDIELLKGISRAIHRHGIAKVALHNVRSFRHRVVPIQMHWETGYAHVRSFVEPDIIFIDADKNPEGLMLAHELFPAATLCGCDWDWQDESGIYPVRDPIRRIAALSDSIVRAKHHTWVLS